MSFQIETNHKTCIGEGVLSVRNHVIAKYTGAGISTVNQHLSYSTPCAMSPSCILYENSSRTVFLIDIPTSITLGQDLPHTASPEPTTPTKKDGKRKHILSTPPLRAPYASPPEPKTDKARAQVLQRIPALERGFHAEIEPLVREGLREIREGYGKGGGDSREWCLGRHVIDDMGAGSLMSQGNGDGDVTETEDSRAYEQALEDRDPPVILSPTHANTFESISGLRDVIVKNTSAQSAALVAGHPPCVFNIPPLSNFLLCTLSTSRAESGSDLIPGLPRDQRFNLILLDPPWPNRSVRRSGHYHTQTYLDMDILTQQIGDILRIHLLGMGGGQDEPIAAIWVTNASKSRKAAYDAIQSAGLSVCEEWVWIKTTTNGEPITPVDGLWRKPYEILMIGKRNFQSREGNITRRVIAAVPDVHSRKPGLKELFEKVFFSTSPAGYTALEVFARNLTAGWWACGNEVLKFTEEGWWVDDI